MTVLITLTTAGTDTGPFSLYSNIDGFVTPFETGVSKLALLAGYTSTLVPDFTATVRVKSTGTCVNYTDLAVSGGTTTTTTSSTTTTVVSCATWVGDQSCSFTTAGGGGSSCMGSGTLTITGSSYSLQGYVSIDSGSTPLSLNQLTLLINGGEYHASTTSPYVAGYTADIILPPGTYPYSFLIEGSGGTNTGGGGGLFGECVTPSIQLSTATCKLGNCNDNASCTVHLPVNVYNAPVGYYVEMTTTLASDASVSYLQSNGYVVYTENNALGSVQIKLDLYDTFGGTLLATTGYQNVTHQSYWSMLNSCT